MPSGNASSPAVQILTRHDIRVVDLAVLAGTTPATVSRWLSGVHAYPDTFPDVLAKFLEPDAVADVLDAVKVSARVVAERKAQGLPPTVTDPEALTRVAAVASRQIVDKAVAS